MGFEVEKDWTTAAGYRAVVLMGSRGYRTGYVGLPKEHLLHGAEYGEKHPRLLFSAIEDQETGKRSPIEVLLIAAGDRECVSPSGYFNVHGSVTYSSNDDGYPVEHDGLWWLGFDAGHSGDAPSLEWLIEHPEERGWYSDGIHRSLGYCIGECESLAEQLSKVGVQ